MTPHEPVDRQMQETARQISEYAQERAQALFERLPVLGHVTWLMSQQPGLRHLFLSDIEWRVLPPLMLNQAKLYMNGDSPAAYAAWACLSAEAVERYRRAPSRLAPVDWKSGGEIWLIDLVAPFGGADAVLHDLRETMFPSSPIRQLMPVAGSVDGRDTRVMVWEPLKSNS